jgi:hypothetical protein
MKPRFTKLFDIKSLDEWEESCRILMDKLESDFEVNLEDYHKATRLYEQWEILFNESKGYQENVESVERNNGSISFSY